MISSPNILLSGFSFRVMIAIWVVVAGRGGKLTTVIGYHILEGRVRRHNCTDIAKKSSFMVGDESGCDQLKMADDELYDEVIAYLQS